MSSRRSFLVGCIVATAFVWLDATPAHAAVQSAGILDRATQLFQASVTKWGNVTTHAAQVLFWMLATVACVWELGGLALRGGSMDAALAFLLRFGFIEGLWFWIIQYAVPIGTAIIDSLRKLGSLASGRPQDLMPSSILDAGFAILWKTIKFVFASGLTAPIVSFFALLFATAIFITFVFTALNMVLLIVSQWFLLYGGIFFLGFGGLPSESDKAKNYLYLSLSIGAQLFVMAGIVGIGQSFIEAIYAQLSGDTSLGELAVILCVALVIYKLANEIPKMFAQFVPGAYSQHGYGGAAVLGGLVALGASFTAATAMAKSAATTMAGAMRAASAAHSAAKAQSHPHFTARSQTGVSAAVGDGSIGPAGVGASARAQTHTHGPLGSMLTASGIGPSPANGAHKLASSSRAGTNTPTPKSADAPKAPPSPGIGESANDSTRAARTPPRTSDGTAPTSSDSASQPTAAPPRGSTQLDQQMATPEPDSHAAGTSPANADTQSGSMTERAESAVSDGETLYAATRPEEADSIDAPSSESSEAHAETSPTTHEAASNAAANASSDTVQGMPARADASTSTPEAPGSGSSSAAAHTQTSAANPRSSNIAATTLPASGSSTAAAASSASSPASGSSSTAAQVAGVSTQAAAASVPATTTTSEQSTHSAASNANSAGSSPTQSRAAGGGAPADSNWSKPPSAASATGPGGSTPDLGTQRSSTAIGGSQTILAAAKILGEQAVQHQRERLQRAKADFWAEADQTAGGQIAKAIRKAHGLDKGPTDSAASAIDSESDSTNAADSSGDDFATDQGHTSGPRHPADWVTGDEPMTDKQSALLELKLGDQFDPNLTKAEAAILIDEILNED